MDLHPADIGTAYRLTNNHFPPSRSPKRQNVKLSVQIISSRVAATLERAYELNLKKGSSFTMPPGTRATASFPKLVNDYFDIFNTNKPIYDSRPTKQAFGFKKH